MKFVALVAAAVLCAVAVGYLVERRGTSTYCVNKPSLCASIHPRTTR